MEEHGVKIHETESVKASDGFAASAGDSLEKHGAHALDGFRPDPTDYFASLVQAANAAGLRFDRRRGYARDPRAAQPF